jgi:hypothetical protein
MNDFFELRILMGVIVSWQKIYRMFDKNTNLCKFTSKGQRVEAYPVHHVDDKYILGVELHRYYQKYTSCDNCFADYKCRDCVGITDNGKYDTCTIGRELCLVDEKNICSFCYHDNKQNMIDKRCDKCNRLQHNKRNIIDDFDNFLTDHYIDGSIRFYYYVECCPCCTG